jgi:peroxiredoxin
MSLAVGDRAPDFELRDQHGRTVSLSSSLGGRSVVLVFYPFAFSRVCTGELHGLRDHLRQLTAAGGDVLAVSCDPMFALRVFADQDRLEFPLLSDFWPHGAVASAYDVLDAERGCARRSTFIIDPAGTVRWSVHNAMGAARDLDAYVRVLEQIATDPDAGR